MVHLSARPGYEFGLSIVLVMMVWFISFQTSWAVSLKTGRKLPKISFNRNFSGVYFDSMDFVVNNGLAISLDESGLAHLLRKIHTRFDRILVNVNIPQRAVGNFSNDQLPEAAAKLNLRLNAGRPSSPKHLKLAILVSVEDWGNEETIQSRFQELIKVMINANSIFPGTVKTVVLEMTNLSNEACDVYKEFRKIFFESATIGVKVSLKTAMDAISSNESPDLGKFKTDVIRDQSLGILHVTENIDDLAGSVAVPVAIEILAAQFRRFKKLFQDANSVAKLALITTWPDTDDKGLAKYGEFVEFWDRLNEWAAESKTSIILVQAFDTPFATGTLTSKTNGWWRLIPDSSYLHPSQFVFEEKLSLIDWKPREANGAWLSQPAEFNRPLVGVQFDPSSLKSRIRKPALNAETNLHPLIQKMSTKFSKIFVSTSNSNKEPNSISSVPGAIARWNINGSRNSESPMELIMTFDETTVDDVLRYSQEANDLYAGMVSQLIYDPTAFDKEKLLSGYLAMVKVKDNMKVVGTGIKLELEICDDRQRFHEVMDLLREDFFSEFQIPVLYFSGVVPTESSKLGVDRFLPLLTVKFENCRKRVNEYLSTWRGLSGMDVGFITGWPLKGEGRLEDLVEFISFWEGINDWALRMKTPVILFSAFDSLRSGLSDGKPEDLYGWWSAKLNSTTGEFYASEDKKQAAFRIATEGIEMDESSQLTTIVAISVTGLVIVIVALLTVFLYLKKRQSAVLTNEEIALFFNGGDSNAYTGSPENMNGPYQKLHLELPKSSFTIDETCPLGSGAYGMVCCGTIQKSGEGQEQVAVKMTKIPSTGFALRGLLFEIKILSYLGKHPNIVGMVGAHTAELRKGRVLVFLELCEEGSLQGYLRKWKTSKIQIGVANEADDLEVFNDRPDSEDEMSELDASLVNDMGRWSLEIANGMEFIASKHIVHLDIATRNVLLTSEKRAKITDFGLSRRMYDYQSYIKKHQEPLPWRSMAPESLKRSEFTEKSDVWAFGILLWEIYTLGDEPYPGLSWDVNFPTKLERGLRPGEPTHSQEGVYSIMLHCWSTIPERRPTFAELVSGFQKLRADVPNEFDVKDEAHGHCKANVPEASYPITRSDVEGKPAENNCKGDPEPIANTPGKSCPAFTNRCMMWSALVIVLVLIVTFFTTMYFWGMGHLAASTSGFGMQPIPPPLEIGWNITGSKGAQNESGKLQVLGEAMKEGRRNGTWLGHKLFLAIQGNWDKEEAVKALVQKGADVNVKNNLDETPLMSAVNCGNDKSVCLRIIEFLIENGADVDARDIKTHTFLHKLFLNSTDTLSPAQFHQIAVNLISINKSRLFTTKMEDDTFIFFTPIELALKIVEVENETLSLLSRNRVNFTTTNRTLCAAIIGRRSLQLISHLRELGAECLFDLSENITALHQAARDGYGLVYFLNTGLDINQLSSRTAQTPLHWAVWGSENRLETVRTLIDRGANVSIRDANLQTPLMLASAGYNNLPYVDKVLQLLRDARLASGNPDNVTPDELGHQLFDAILNQYEDTINVLLNAGANVNVRNSRRESPLITAGRCGGRENISSTCWRILKSLIEVGGDAHAKDEVGYTFLHRLVSYPHQSTTEFHEIASYLATKNLTKMFNIHREVGHAPPIMEALRQIDVGIDTLDLLSKNGVYFKGVQDNEGTPILHYAVNKYRNVEASYTNAFLSKLVDLGADWKALNRENDNLLYRAIPPGNVEALSFFLKKGLDVNAQNVYGETPLHHAIYNVNGPRDDLTVVRLFIGHGADAKLKDSYGDTPLAVAIRKNLAEVVKLLKTGD